VLLLFTLNLNTQIRIDMINSEINKVSNKCFEQLFKHNIQFEIPFFQRGYAWESKHWQQLFLDIDEKIISEIDLSTNIEDIEHFFGPIVVLEKRNSDLSIRKFLIIDGQQRITTIYILLAIIRDLLKENAHQAQSANEYASRLNNYLINNVEEKDDYLKLKVFSGKGDRLPTYRIVFDNNNPQSPHLMVDQQLYNSKTNKIDAFFEYSKKHLKKNYNSVPKLWQFAEILLKSLKIVWIPLDENKDDPQAIFESLNDRGMPLSASELICNFLFQPLLKSPEIDFEELHNNYWLNTITKIDSEGNFEDYLRNYLSIGENKVIGQGRRIYTFFKAKNKRLNPVSAKSFLLEVFEFHKIYNSIVNPILNQYNNKEINIILINIKSTRMDAATPFILSLLKAHYLKSINDSDAICLMNELFVLLVRRKMCELPTQKYDIIFPNLLNKIANEPDKVKEFQKIIKEENYWVSNQDFENAFINKPLYRPRDLSFTRMILQEIDKTMQAFGQLPDYTTLPTVEHILPQTLDDYWKKYLNEDAENPDLPKYINTIGNLCLLSRPANSHASQNPFDAKKADYTDISALAKDVKNRNVKWNISSIKNRSSDLANKALSIWKWKD